ncbi:lysoplasmalogenase [Pseudomonas putida]|uniref:Lysoplasmalogenase n=1 Tax=Pseudomonas putida TaxID=303 RepID=A0A177SMW7_PSEPU|nr:lysoplasmalogenase [Pseudomonas putida]OAI91758.1 hypothetical protein AYO28_20220 [Pseudomonas putida]
MTRPAALCTFAVAGCALYIYAANSGAAWLAFASKPVPVLAMILWLFDAPAGTYRRWILIGLGFSILGDLALAWPADLFIIGLAAFFCAHLAYLRAYLDDQRKTAPWALLIAGTCGVGLFTLLAWHDLGDLLVPVAAYALVISAMLWRALACAGFAAIGAISFVLSDSLIGIDRFVSQFGAAPTLIILFYWLGQWAISASAQRQQSTTPLTHDRTPATKSV